MHHVRVHRPASPEPALPEQAAFPSARSLLLTILGALVYGDSEPVWTSALLYVMRAGGFTEQAARQAIARGAAAGWLTGGRSGRETRWTLGPEILTMFEAGSERVFAFSEQPALWDGEWLVVIISIPHEQRMVRKKLYGALRWAGLGNPTPGIWLTPHVDRADEVDGVIEELGLGSSTLSFVGRPATVGLRDAEIIERSWDLGQVATTYQELLARFSRLDPEPGDEVLMAQLELTSALRHFPFIDPQLPEALTPGWIGREATRQLRDLSAAWSVAARARWREIIATTAPR